MAFLSSTREYLARLLAPTSQPTGDARRSPVNGFPTAPTPYDGEPSKAGLPTKRISIDDEWPSMLSNLGANLYSFVLPRYWPLEIYDLLNNLCLQVPDLRQAVGHIVNLGNTGHIVQLKGDTESAIEAAVDRMERKAQVIFPWAAGSDGLINNMFAQVARTGAISMEWVPKADLSGIANVFVVPVSEIRWVPRPDMMGYYPVQIPKNLMSWTNGTKPLMIVLNPRTFYYANAEMLDNCPYAIPPFLAALEPVALQRSMVKNIYKVVKKLGIMGLMTYAVEPPKPHPGESDEKYHARCMKYLEEVTCQIKDNFGDGIAAGFKGAFEFTIQGVSGDARGIAEIFKQNEEQLFSAISADPAMHGRTYSTTETYASVVYSKMISQLDNIQRMVAHAMEFGWGLDFLLAGLPADVKVAFKASQALSNLQEAQSKMVEIANAEALYQGGVIDQDQKANLLGYPIPAEDSPRPDPAVAQDQNLDQRKTGGKTDNTPSTRTTKRKQAKPVKHSTLFEYNATMKKYYPYRDQAYAVQAINMLKDKPKKEDEHDHEETDALLDPHAGRFL